MYFQSVQTCIPRTLPRQDHIVTQLIVEQYYTIHYEYAVRVHVVHRVRLNVVVLQCYSISCHARNSRDARFLCGSKVF